MDVLGFELRIVSLVGVEGHAGIVSNGREVGGNAEAESPANVSRKGTLTGSMACSTAGSTNIDVFGFELRAIGPIGVESRVGDDILGRESQSRIGCE